MGYRKILEIGQKFHKLTVLQDAGLKKTGLETKSRSYSICQCDCGKIVTVANKSLINSHAKSCGCLKGGKRIFTDKEKSARKIWHDYEKLIPFNVFYQLSQQNCFYCNQLPSNRFSARKEEYFIYNGLDRIDSSKSHSEDNLVPCCKICNFLKSNRSLSDFYLHLKNIINHQIIDPASHRGLSNNIPSPEIGKTFYFSLKKRFRDSYKDANFDLITFYKLSQLSCYYCGLEKSNCYSSYKSDKTVSEQRKSTSYFNYNGLDRIDSNLSHDYTNVVTCCKWCNTAKSDNSFADYISYLERIKTYHKESHGN